jgi:hypothetical protein
VVIDDRDWDPVHDRRELDFTVVVYVRVNYIGGLYGHFILHS